MAGTGWENEKVQLHWINPPGNVRLALEIRNVWVHGTMNRGEGGPIGCNACRKSLGEGCYPQETPGRKEEGTGRLVLNQAVMSKTSLRA